MTISNRIKLLSEQVINKIAAGEVVERPASVIKELIENSIDAGADYIQIEVKGAGETYIRITDNGHGMHPEDAIIAFERHATSKISRAEDLETIGSLGFRGEALSSIASVSKIRLTTRAPSEISGTEVKIEGGKVKGVKDVACAPGTTIEIKNLFFNIPARKKFLKKETTEMTYISDTISQFVLSYPEVSFSVSRNNKIILQSPGNGLYEDSLLTIYGESIACEMLQIIPKPEFEEHPIKIGGFIGSPSIARTSNRFMTLFVNRRSVRSRLISKAVSRACQGLFSSDRYPIVCLNLKMPPHLVDVNVHPQKLEVRFRDEKLIYMMIFESLQHTLFCADLIQEVPLKAEDEKKNLDKSFEFVSETGRQIPLISDSTDRTPLAYYDEKQENTDRHSIPSQVPTSPQSISQLNSENESNSKIQNFHQPSSPVRKIFTPENLPGGKVVPFSEWGDAPMVHLPGEPETFLPEPPQFPLSQRENQQQEFELLKNFTILGQFDNCFIIGISGKTILLIDQHVAHERVLYEKLLKQYANSPIRSQNLLFPFEMKILPGERTPLLENLPLFEELGFKFSSEVDGAIFVTSIPTLLTNNHEQDLIQESINQLLHEIEKRNYSDLKKEVITTMSCKMAVKANKVLVPEEMDALIEQLSMTENPFFCPHGRPVVLKITRQQLNRIFQRH